MQPCILQLSQSSNNFTDQSALIAFKSQITIGPNDTVFAGGNWSTTTNFCEWFGVSCSRRRQRVTAVNLSYVGLHGTISPHIANLSFLVSLDLKNNSFSGFLPHEISHLHRLRKLSLKNNLLEEGRVSTKSDIYSYGIILLEIITRKKPTDEMFVGELAMRQWIASLPDRIEVVDDGLLKIENERDVTSIQTVLLSILELGLRCSEESPDERPDIKDVVTKVNKIKLALL
ncbi:hypothetical protein SO802_012022 [Lithocarpus litseifolius]|uniref:Leucine-rich repeat-containing N-terminal plant-type domain-containing protein n=1 Tax=Lithocarpus litseifolius TaxID=425828 RepID=A0AAW2D711_9ROSI